MVNFLGFVQETAQILPGFSWLYFPFSIAIYFWYIMFIHIGIPRTNSIGKVFDVGGDISDNLGNSEEAILRGEYAVIRSLIRVLEVSRNHILFNKSFL